jgi:TonB family protein
MVNLLPGFVVAYSLQLAALVGSLWIGLRILAMNAPGVRLRAWQAALVASVVLPALLMLPSTTARTATTASASVLAMVFVPTMPGDAAASPFAWRLWFALALLTGTVLRGLWLVAGWIALRRRFSHADTASHPQFDERCLALAVRARLVYGADVTQPFTFGTKPAIVVVPTQLSSASEPVLAAIFTHELMHVARRDWQSVIVEEAIRALLWFHPGVWLIVNEVRQAREEVIDRATVRSLGSRRTYLETLIALADRSNTPRLWAALPFFRFRQLKRRITAIASEASMSRPHLVLTCSAVLALTTVTFGAASRAFPLPAPQGEPSQTPSSPSALERTAFVAPADAPPPERTRYVAPKLPANAFGMGRPEFEIRLVLDAAGRVAEARVLNVTAGAIDIPGVSKTFDAVLAAVRQWEFKHPERAPLAITVVLTLDPAEQGGEAASIERPLPIDVKKAVYPEAAKAKKIQGEVELEADIDATGHVSDARVTRSDARELDEAAITAVRGSTFRPGMKDGRPVPVKTTITMRFALK